jgi:hypothetical protein
MQIVKINKKEATLCVNREELLVFNAALNEICNGIDVFEFETRIGKNRHDVAAILEKIGLLLDQMEST